MNFQTPVAIEGRAAAQLAVSAVGAQTAPLEKGTYDVWCDVDVWVKVARYFDLATPPVAAATPNRAQDVTTLTGYKIFAGNTISLDLNNERCIGAIAGGAGTLNFIRIA